MGVEADIPGLILVANLLLVTIGAGIWLGWKSLLKEHSYLYRPRKKSSSQDSPLKA